MQLLHCYDGIIEKIVLLQWDHYKYYNVTEAPLRLLYVFLLAPLKIFYLSSGILKMVVLLKWHHFKYCNITVAPLNILYCYSITLQIIVLLQ